MSGQILNERYEVEQQLGKQAGRWTLLATDLQTQQPVVVKLMFVDDALSPEDFKLFGREMQTLQSISHPCIPPYIGYFEQELPMSKVVGLVQAYIPGRSLQEYVNLGRAFTEAEAKQLAKVLLKILDYLQTQTPPILHRDIKPSSIVLADRRPHLVDFGSVKTLLNQESAAFTMVGTYGYMAPEQLSGRAVLASDLFGIGTTLIAVLTGKSPAELPRDRGRLDIASIVDLSPAFLDWLYWMTEPSLDRRLSSAKEALQALEAEQIRGGF